MPTLRYGGNNSIEGQPGAGPGGQTITYNHPRELKGVYPTPPLQPLASWTDAQAAFQLCIQQMIDATDVFANAPKAFLTETKLTTFSAQDVRIWAFTQALGVLQLNHVQASPSDCPGGSVPAVLNDRMKAVYGTNSRLPGYFTGTWIT